MKALHKNIIAIILVIGAVTTFIFFEEQLPSFNLSELEISTVIGVLGYISIIMLVVEQCIEIFVYDPNEKEKQQQKKRLESINQSIKKIKESDELALEDDTELTEKQKEMLKKLMNEKRLIEEKRLDQGKKREQKIQLISFTLGLLISFSGIRVLSGTLFNPEGEILLGIQGTIIQSIDIILTAGIIAGGSDRVHSLIKRAKVALNPYEE